MNCFAYIRVSTTKQRDQGASLEAQRDAIERYARKHDLTITRWFTETRTAAKQGRSEFARLIKLLRKGEAQGAIVHKIDRSARNLKDWSDFIGLMEYGVAIHVASENLDLTSRGGRLSADIQAVVAADYIRNLRLEALKGINARYQQGLLPGMAPIGYQNNGPGKVKTIDPKAGPLVRELFERYATGKYSLRSLQRVMNERGLRNLRGKALSVNAVSRVLNQPFYTGQILVRRTGEVYEGKHEPLVSLALYNACQDILGGRTKHRSYRHRYTYSRLLQCALCSYSLIAEKQKGHVYYRCHTKDCPLKTTREENIEQVLGRKIQSFHLQPEHRHALEERIKELLGHRAQNVGVVEKGLELELDKVSARLERLTDLLLDDVLGEDAYRKKKQALVERQLAIKEQIARPAASATQILRRIEKYLELAEKAWLSYETGNAERRRQIVETVTSNLTVSPENVVVELQTPFQALSQWEAVSLGGGERDEPRTLTTSPKPKNNQVAQTPEHIARRLLDCAKAEEDEKEA